MLSRRLKVAKPTAITWSDRLGRVGKNGSRMRHEIGCGLTDQHCQAKNQGKTHGEARIAQLPFVSPGCGASRGSLRQCSLSLVPN